MESGRATEPFEKIRQQTAAVLDALVTKAGEFELPQPPDGLEGLRR